ncbi:MAG: MBL fold metallo-hydrolase [Deltaproteobacteria bacterium]|nr:MBL fold metallo-hydrolase [Deltaproteobacteria bacterium]
MTAAIPLTITILGSGTSTGVPLIGCDCDVCTSNNPKNHRTRASLLITRKDTGEHLVIDTGPDFRQQMLRANVRKLSHVLYTHTHADHSHGFDDLRVFCFKNKEAIDCYLPEEMIEEFRTRFSYAFHDTGYPGTPPRVSLHPIPEQLFHVMGLPIEAVRLPHGAVNTAGFRLGRFAYCTDFKHFPSEILNQWRGKVDTMIASGVHFHEHKTHSNVQETIQLFHELRVRQGIITHLAHQVEFERDSANLPENILFAYDGLRLNVTT